VTRPSPVDERARVCGVRRCFCGAVGDWEQLFSRGEGYVGTELYQNARAETLFLTIDTWRSESDWRAFLDEWRAPYEALDYRLGSMTTWERALVEATR
jgi:heme-degrading monooxygenase HmoA